MHICGTQLQWVKTNDCLVTPGWLKIDFGRLNLPLGKQNYKEENFLGDHVKIIVLNAAGPYQSCTKPWKWYVCLKLHSKYSIFHLNEWVIKFITLFRQRTSESIVYISCVIISCVIMHWNQYLPSHKYTIYRLQLELEMHVCTCMNGFNHHWLLSVWHKAII